MSRKLIMTLAIFFVMFSVTVSSGQGTGSIGSKLIDELAYDDISWDIPRLGEDVIVDTLPNGMVLFMMEDHRLPVFNVRALIRVGEMFVPKEQMGVIELADEVMRTGGTATLEPDKLNEELEYIAASVETWIGNESGGVSLNCMSKDIDKGLGLFADVMMHPAFRQEKIDLQKDKIKESIRRRNDSPGSICSREFYNLIYDDHFYGTMLEWDYVKDVTQEDLIEFHSKYYFPNNVWLGITGDFDMDEIKLKIMAVFEEWESRDIEFPQVPKVSTEPRTGVYLIDKDLTQSNIRFGHLGIDEYNPDRFPIAIMNYILGGGSFTSRMTTEVRSNMGLAYSVGCGYQTSRRDLGTFYAYCQTKTETTHKAISEMVRQIRLIREEKVTEYELNSAKDSFINRFVFRFTNPSSIVAQLMHLEYEGLPRDFYETYLDNVRDVTKDEVLRVAKEYLKPDKMTFLVVGKIDGFDAPLDEFGEITNIELTEPIVD
jgi:predicted Zn-dependent peptidase